MNKEIVKIWITGVLTMAMIAPAGAAFYDVTGDDSYAQAVQWLEDIGAVHSGRYFNPDQYVTKAEFLKMAFIGSGIEINGFPTSAPATDVPIKIWYSPYVDKILEWGIWELGPGGMFYPDSTISQAESLKISMKLWGIGVSPKVPADVKYTDIRKDSWALPYMYRAETLGLVEKGESGSVQPFRRLTRADTAELLYNFNFIAGDEFGMTEMPAIKVDFTNANSGNEYVDFMMQVWQTMENGYLYEEALDDKKLGYGAIEGLVEALDDPYSEFYPPEDNEDFTSALENEVVGIGAHVIMEDEGLVIVAPVAESPADKAGLLPRDIILRVDDQDVINMSQKEAVSLIRGPEGTSVKITIRRPSTGQIMDFNMTRELIDEDTVTMEIVDRNYVVARITQFTSDTSWEFEDKVVNGVLEKQGQIKGIILDLRNNPGGYLDAAVRVASFMMGSGETITSTRDRFGDGQQYTVAEDGELLGIKTVILINAGSASASEILAGAMARNGHARLIGEKTFGKGTAQLLWEFNDGSVLKMTNSEWLLPDGTSINKNGISPDILISDNQNTTADEQMAVALTEIQK